jgi:16S rRNA (guanine527-N7)-methyltransferase
MPASKPRLFHVKHDADTATLPAPNVSRETRARLDIYADLIRSWSPTINLVGHNDLPHLWDRHIADCLQLLPLLPPNCTGIDMGSGAGLPGLVLAIASTQHFHLIESDQRKAAFLRHAARACNVDVTIHTTRIQQIVLPPARLITARALAPLPQLLALAAPLLAPDGVCVFLKGRTAGHELTQAAAEWHMRVQRWQSHTDPAALILHISGLARHAGPER